MRLGWVAIAVILWVSAVAPQEPGRPNVMLVTVDALRADRLRPDLAPALAALAARGVRFERMYAHAPATLPSHASVLTGLLPPSHGVRNDGFRLDDTVVTLAELLQANGYRTGAFVGSSLLDVRYGLDQGFDEYDDRYEASASDNVAMAERPAADVLKAAASWIARQREPWFTWIQRRCESSDAMVEMTPWPCSAGAVGAALGGEPAAVVGSGSRIGVATGIGVGVGRGVAFSMTATLLGDGAGTEGRGLAVVAGSVCDGDGVGTTGLWAGVVTFGSGTVTFGEMLTWGVGGATTA